jgi:hypothetical protein
MRQCCPVNAAYFFQEITIVTNATKTTIWMIVTLAAIACGPAALNAAEPVGMVRGVKVLSDKAPDCSSMKSIVSSVTRGCKTNDEKGVAIYNAGRFLWYHHQYPAEKGGVASLKLINVYGWSLCGGQHTVLASMWRAAGWDWRYVGWRGHTTVECRYDDQWHYFDTFLKVYAWRNDPNAPGGRTVASQADIKADPALIGEQFVLDKARKVWYMKPNRFEIIGDRANWLAPAFFVCGDQPRGVTKGVQVTRPSGVSSKLGHAGIKFNEDGYDTNVNLAPGCSLELMWRHIDKAQWFKGRKYSPRHSCGDKEYRNCPAIGPLLEPYRYLDKRGARTYSNGVLRFAPDFGDKACLSALADTQNIKWSKGQLAPADASKPAWITVKLQSPYIMTRAGGKAAGIDKAEISLDAGKTYRQVDLAEFDEAIGGKYACLLRLSLTKPLTSLDIKVIVQHNRCALPYLSPGANKVTVSAIDAKSLGANKLVVTYAYALGQRNTTYEGLCDQGAELARAHQASWSQTPTVVQKIFSAGDLPATFDIPVPTPDDKSPVYPRMLFLRREVIGPGQKPAPLPTGAVAATVGSGRQLKTLPNPFIAGIAKPPVRIIRKTKTTTIDLAPGHFVTRSGKTPTSDFIKWPKRAGEKVPAIAFLIGGQLNAKTLPAARDLAAARLVFGAVRAHQKAPTKVGVTLLKAPFKPGRPYDFANLGDLTSTLVAPKLPAGAPDWKPPKQFKLDVTRAMRAIASGQTKFHGFALRVAPDRGVDDGWTVRIHLPKNPKIHLEIDTYTNTK